ncbi:hypothetical protein ACJX0J_034733, partial [Zea mays]
VRRRIKLGVVVIKCYCLVIFAGHAMQFSISLIIMYFATLLAYEHTTQHILSVILIFHSDFFNLFDGVTIWFTKKYNLLLIIMDQIMKNCCLNNNKKLNII